MILQHSTSVCMYNYNELVLFASLKIYSGYWIVKGNQQVIQTVVSGEDKSGIRIIKFWKQTYPLERSGTWWALDTTQVWTRGISRDTIMATSNHGSRLGFQNIEPSGQSRSTMSTFISENATAILRISPLYWKAFVICVNLFFFYVIFITSRPM